MRLGDRDRDEICELLSRHAALGRLELDELERRVELVINAQTREQAVTVLADLPPLPAAEGGGPGAGQRAGHQDDRRRHGQVEQPQADWVPTQERFRDPRSGRIMRVWSDAAGGRHYLPEG